MAPQCVDVSGGRGTCQCKCTRMAPQCARRRLQQRLSLTAADMAHNIAWVPEEVVKYTCIWLALPHTLAGISNIVILGLLHRMGCEMEAPGNQGPLQSRSTRWHMGRQKSDSSMEALQPTRSGVAHEQLVSHGREVCEATHRCACCVRAHHHAALARCWTSLVMSTLRATSYADLDD